MKVGKHDYGLHFCKQYVGIVKNERNIGRNVSGEFLNIPLVSFLTFEKRNAHTTPVVFAFGHTGLILARHDGGK